MPRLSDRGGVARVERDRPLVGFARLGELALLAVGDAELVPVDRLARAELAPPSRARLTASGSLPAWRWIRPRLACGPASSGWACARLRKRRSASVAWPARSARAASSKARCDSGLTATSAGADVTTVLAARPAQKRRRAHPAPAPSSWWRSSPPARRRIERMTASRSTRRSRSRRAPARSAATATARRAGSADRIDDSFAVFDLAVAHRTQLAQRVEARSAPTCRRRRPRRGGR